MPVAPLRGVTGARRLRREDGSRAVGNVAAGLLQPPLIARRVHDAGGRAARQHLGRGQQYEQRCYPLDRPVHPANSRFTIGSGLRPITLIRLRREHPVRAMVVLANQLQGDSK